MKENVIRVLSLWMAMLFEMCIFAQEAHKVYYDEDWKGVQKIGRASCRERV